MVDFYENSGLEKKGAFAIPGKEQGFAQTQGMYADLVVMGTSGSCVESGVFMLNDDDVKALYACALLRSASLEKGAAQSDA